MTRKSPILQVRIRPMPVLMALAGAVAGLGFGWLGREVRGRGSDSPMGPDIAGEKSSGASDFSFVTASGAGAAGTRIPSTAERETGAVMDRAARLKGVDYWLHLLGAAEKAPVPVLAALADALKEESPALELVAERWAELGPETLLSALEKKPARHLLPSGIWTEDRSSQRLQKILLSAWSQKDAAGLRAALSKAAGGGPDTLRTAKTECFRLLAATDPAQALEQAAEWRIGVVPEDRELVLPWARQNARRIAGKMLTGWPAPESLSSFESLLTGEIVKPLAASDPAGVLDLAMAANARNPCKRSFSTALLGEWAKRDPASAAAYVSSGKVTQELLPDMIAPLMAGWGVVDAEAAMAWADQHLKGLARDLVPEALVKALGAQDPAKAAAFLDQLEGEDARYEGMRQLTKLAIKGKDKAALLKAFHWMMAMPDPAMRNVAMDCGSGEIVKAAPEEVQAWLRTPEGAQAPVSLLASVGFQMAETNGPAAMEWAVHQRPEVADEVRQRILQGWNYRDPAAAQAWVRSIPDSPERAARITFVTTTAAERNGEEGVTAWLDSLPVSDRPAMRQGLGNAWSMDAALRSRLLEKYR